MPQILPTSELDNFIRSNPSSLQGCFVDTNLLFAADYEIHHLHESAADVCGRLYSKSIPIYANSIIRSELLDLKRRVFVTEGLIDTLTYSSDTLPTQIKNQISSLQTKIRKRESSGKHLVLQDREIKNFRNLFEALSGKGAWKKFCDSFLKDRLHNEWENITQSKKVQYVGTSSDILKTSVDWKPMVDLIESSAIGVSDAMIINFFLTSETSFMISADRDIAHAMEQIDTDKVLFCPDNISQ